MGTEQKWQLYPDGIPELIQYNNWTIWCWTGWKGTKRVLANNIPADQAPPCFICNKPMVNGDVIKFEQCMMHRHWLCVHPDNAPDRLMGQWVAQRGEQPNMRHMYINVDNLVTGFVAGGEYKRGESFPISTEGEFITEHTPEAVREAAKQAGLQKLKDLIDQVDAAKE